MVCGFISGGLPDEHNTAALSSSQAISNARVAWPCGSALSLRVVYRGVEIKNGTSLNDRTNVELEVEVEEL